MIDDEIEVVSTYPSFKKNHDENKKFAAYGPQQEAVYEV
jgi:hypothetical protein